MAEGRYRNKASTRGAKPGERRGGRAKGSQNKVTKAAKEAIAECFERMGSIDALTEWAMANPKEFYTIIWPKIIPLELSGPNGGAIEVRAVERRIIPIQIEPLKLVSNASS